MQGNAVSFTCSATGDATISFAWFDKSDVLISNSSAYTVNNSTGEITINAASYARDHGMLYCMAYNYDIVNVSQRTDRATAHLNIQGGMIWRAEILFWRGQGA